MSEDRPSGTRILVTVAIVVAIAAALLLAAWAVIGWLAPRPPGVFRSPSTAPQLAQASQAPPASRMPTSSETSDSPAAAPLTPRKLAIAPVAKQKTTGSSRAVVVIDAGHSGRADKRTEPVAPGSKLMKPRDAGGTSGVATGNPESLVNLQVALKLRTILGDRGMKVVMVRTSQATRISSIERARVANAAHADVFVRLHCDGSTNRAKRGISVLVPAKAPWTLPIYLESRKAGAQALSSVVAATGAANVGLVERSDLAGFNWAKVPSFLVEMGFMSNPAEDRLLATDAYQRRLAKGIADAVSAYLANR